jgi:hypothetical protein
MARRYYVVFEDNEWTVMLEEGRNLKTFGSDRPGAIDYAKKLGRRNKRPVMVNYKDGRTGAAYHSVKELTK